MTSNRRGFALVRKLALALPDVEEGTSWGAVAFKLRGKMFACQPTNKAAEPDSLAVMLDFSQRDELLAAEPDVYYLKDHYVGYPCLLVRLKKVHPDALRDLLGMAWRYIDAKSKRKPRARAPKRRAAVRASLVVACLLGSALDGGARQSADAIARAVVIGQAYASGNVYVAGFVEDEPRPWPTRIQLWPLRHATNAVMAADFFRTVTQDSEEHYTFPQRETDAGSTEPDVFSTIDRMAVSDRNLARYRASTSLPKTMSIVGWDDRFQLVDIEVFVQGPPRPLTPRERAAVAAEKKSAYKDAECTTVPQYLDEASQLLTARLADSQTRIRLSHYMTPGCAGHLSDIYVLDVLVPGQEPRRYEFRHYQGLL